MTLRRVVGFLFGAGERWEYKLVALRIVVIAVVTLGIYVLISSDFKRYAAFAFWLFVIVVIASIVYQYRRRWRETRRDQGVGSDR